MNADAILSYASKSKEFSNSLSLFANTVEDDVAENRLLKNLSNTPAWGFGEKLANELSVLGFYISAHPLDQYKDLISRSGLATSLTLSQRGDRTPVQIAVNVNSYSRRRTKTGKDMITINASDSFGNIDAVAFGSSAAEFAQILSGENVVLISGKISNRDDRVSIFVDSITPLNAWVAHVAKKITLEIKNQAVLTDVKKILDSMSRGSTHVILNLHTGDKIVKIELPNTVELSGKNEKYLAEFGVKVGIE